ncbi:hypothetical protein ABT297_13680 [Dactylosporangium sp. NPDC000555]|uniref:hypothetical protein n=1 Tax=Dactylosporangium sp. NPDC000555 TaxID=3154260 RepID=UPI00332C6692
MTVEWAFEAVTAVAGRQGGLVTAAQLERAGVDPAMRAELYRRVLLTRVDWDVFEVRGSPTEPIDAYPYAAWLALRPAVFAWERPGAGGDVTADAVLSHEAAARAWRLGAPSLGRVSFIAPEPLPAPRATRVLVETLRPDEVTVRGRLPVTVAHRTVLDLVRGHMDLLELRRVITDAVRLDLVDLAELHRDLVPLAAAHFFFPTEGPEFAHWFLPELDGAALSPRNARALAALLRPDGPGSLDGPGRVI